MRTHADTVRWGTNGHRLSCTHLNTALVQSEPHLKPSALRTDRVGSEWRWPLVPALSQELQKIPLSVKGSAPEQALVHKGLQGGPPVDRPWRGFYRG